MQVASNPSTEKQTGLERQVRSHETPSSISSKTHAVKSEEKSAETGAAQNETSQYLKVLSRVENLLIQNKLPDAAIEGFAGAIKKQIDAMNEADMQMLMKLPVVKMLELSNLDDLPEMIKNDIRNEDKSAVLLNFLREPKFADLMRTDSKPVSKTYTAQSALQTTPEKSAAKKAAEDTPNLIKQVPSTSPTKAGNNIIGKMNTPTPNRAI